LQALAAALLGTLDRLVEPAGNGLVGTENGHPLAAADGEREWQVGECELRDAEACVMMRLM
jgi:hypothetical protein